MVFSRIILLAAAACLASSTVALHGGMLGKSHRARQDRRVLTKLLQKASTVQRTSNGHAAQGTATTRGSLRANEDKKMLPKLAAAELRPAQAMAHILDEAGSPLTKGKTPPTRLMGSSPKKQAKRQPEAGDLVSAQAATDYLKEYGYPDTAYDSMSRLAVWVTGFPRSGSSTTLSLVKAAADSQADSQAPGKVFSLFEPCHVGDELEPWLAAEGCSGLISGVARCDFAGVQALWGWSQPHTTNNHTKIFNAGSAARMCINSDIVTFKTVDYGHIMEKYLWLLDRVPALRIVATVRDPRSIYASWKTTKPFRGLLKKRWLCGTCPGGQFYNMTQLCDAYAANLDVQDSRVHTIVFEELLRQPEAVVRRVYDFLGRPFGDSQRAWINRTFDASDCPTEPTWHQGFADCHTNSSNAVQSWRKILNEEELNTFNNYPACLTVAKAYGYPLK